MKLTNILFAIVAVYAGYLIAGMGINRGFKWDNKLDEIWEGPVDFIQDPAFPDDKTARKPISQERGLKHKLINTARLLNPAKLFSRDREKKRNTEVGERQLNDLEPAAAI